MPVSAQMRSLEVFATTGSIASDPRPFKYGYN